MAFRPGTVAFGRHESFPLRFGWIAKGLRALRDDPTVFTREDATVVLGVGKNMVSSIRHWLHAATLAQPRPDGRGHEETEIARTAFNGDGHPYLEDDGTIWLLHSGCHQSRCRTAVYRFFDHFHRPVFSNDPTRLINAMLTRSEDFVEPDLAAMEAERRERKIKHLLRQASHFNLALMPVEQTA